jgi:redox-sensing transcriptional repressor
MYVNKTCIHRISHYKEALHRLYGLGFIKVFSDNLADAVGVTAAQVRKDFSILGITGSRRGGYKIEYLIEQINSVLGKDTLTKLILVGVGNIGKALLGYQGFSKDNIEIAAAFDSDRSKVNNTAGTIPIFPIDELKSFIKNNSIKIAIIAVPLSAAQQVCDLLVSFGIKGILNFASIRLRSNEDILINNVNLVSEIENLNYFILSGKKNNK